MTAPQDNRRARGWKIVGALSVTETVSWGIVYYAFAVFLLPMQRELGLGVAQLTGAFSVALLVSGVAGIAVGRWLDRHSPRVMMTAGSVLATALLVAWSQVDSVAALYAVWAGLGIAMALVLYEPAFVVLAKWFPEPGERRRAMTAMTLAGALASFLFLPLAQALIDAYGWRDALLLLALVLGVLTIPLHAAVLRPAPAPPVAPHPRPAAAALRSAWFWLLSAAFFLATLATIAMTVHAIPFLVGHGHGAAFAAFAVGLIGVAQIPGRLVFARLEPETTTGLLFALIAAGIALVVALPGETAAVVAGLVLLGMGNGMATLARATTIADRYGAQSFGTIAGVAAATTTAARAVGPVSAALYGAAVGADALLWTLVVLALAAGALALRAESLTALPRLTPETA